MKGDFSRMTFDVAKHFSRVLMQQGRVQLDSDWNEQTAILLHYLQTLAKDLIGNHGGPADIVKDTEVLRKNLGFEIIYDAERINQFKELSGDQSAKLRELFNNNKPRILIGKGRYYIDGILCEIDQYFPFNEQPDYPLVENKELKSGTTTYLIYADVWERHITYIEDDSIREVALGGPDTATRAKIVWQVKTENEQPNGDDIPNSPDGGFRAWVDSQWLAWMNKWQPAYRGLLKARAKQDPKKDSNPCIISPTSSYRGTENQLYRVEIHQGGKLQDKPTFKWSRDNGSTVMNIKLNGTELTVDNPRSLSVGQWLELTNDQQELRGETGTLVKIKKLDGDLVSLDAMTTPMPSAEVPKGEAWPTKARLWNSGEIPVQESDKDWITLTDGVQIQFQPAPKSENQNQYRTGDYWLIPVRVATGDVEWPGGVGKPEPLSPHGVEHHYAPLAIISVKSEGEDIQMYDLRNQFIDLVEPAKV